MKEEIIYEVLKPNECFLLTKDEKGIMYAGNKNGKTFMAKALFPKG